MTTPCCMCHLPPVSDIWRDVHRQSIHAAVIRLSDQLPATVLSTDSGRPDSLCFPCNSAEWFATWRRDGSMEKRRLLALSLWGGRHGEGCHRGWVRGLSAESGRRHRRDRDLWSRSDRVLLRPVPRSTGLLQVAASYTSAVAEAQIGGDHRTPTSTTASRSATTPCRASTGAARASTRPGPRAVRSGWPARTAPRST